MSDFDKTNTAIAFVEEGLFNKEGVERLGNKPVITIKANVDGVDKEIALWFKKDKKTGQYTLTSQGNKFLTGQVKAPYEKHETFTEQSATPTPKYEKSTVNHGEELPF